MFVNPINILIVFFYNSVSRKWDIFGLSSEWGWQYCKTQINICKSPVFLFYRPLNLLLQFITKTFLLLYGRSPIYLLVEFRYQTSPSSPGNRGKKNHSSFVFLIAFLEKKSIVFRKDILSLQGPPHPDKPTLKSLGGISSQSIRNWMLSNNKEKRL